MTNLPRVLLLALFSLQLAGCASLAYGKHLSTNANQLQVGMTTAQVNELLGQPNSVAANMHGTVWTYDVLQMGEVFEHSAIYHVVFMNGVVTGFGPDDGLTALRDANRAAAYQQAGQSMQNFSNQLQEQQRAPAAPTRQECRSRPDGFGGWVTDCGQ